MPESDEETLASVLSVAKGMLASALTSGTSGNVSARLAGGSIAITPSSVHYPDMTIDDLVLLDLDGRQLGGRRSPSSETRLHLACYRAYAETGAVLHSHPRYATMFACARQPVPALIDEAVVYIGGDVPVAPYAMSGTDELGSHAVAALAHVGSALLASHGVVTIAGTPQQALVQATAVETCAAVAWGARALGGHVPLPASTVRDLGEVYRCLRAG